MKFQRIGSIIGTLPRVLVTAALIGITSLAYAVDEDLPPPQTGESPSPQVRTAPGPSISTYTETETSTEDETLPSPSLGGDPLPDPSAQSPESNANQVNRAPEDDEIYLPTPNVQDNINYAPVGQPAPRMSSEDVDWRASTSNRPAFSLYAGMNQKGYKNVLVQGKIVGPSVAASYRLIELAQTLFGHIYFGASWYNVGNVGSISQVKDETFQVGGLFELALGRRFSVFASFLRRTARVSAAKFVFADEAALHPNQNVRDIEDVGEPPTYYLGVGARYDFYVIPHGSIGAQLHIEQDLFMLSLAFSMEPVGRKKLSLNFPELPR